ncbi:LysR family transcriptional regulator [Uruburuella testudinis]|uniref:LysR family transcriptional regulator n=1 Tax=Uruburuella testudinis TaxID=1282863 RepID=A0ABY4DQ31_9NEIS|nr:LysR family transcriptional regulator [Uruburuella testudinis]UOO81068.1 LysR family transcriptional regulator [Uruburuella testudinis]
MNSAIYGQLTVFQAIVAEGSISGAARRLETTAPSVSKSLKLLETHIGLPLFHRTTRKIELTEAGRLLQERTANVVQSLVSAVESVQDLGGNPAGSVRMTVPRFAFQSIIRPHYAEFCRRYPHVQLEISVNDGTVDIIEQGFDLGIRFGDTVGENMVARRLSEPVMQGLYVSADYRAQYGLPQTPAELSNHRLIGYRFITANRILPLVLDDKGQDLTVDMPVSVMVNDIEVMNDAVRKGLGIGRIFDLTWRLLPDREDFIPVLQDYWQRYPAVYLYYPQHSQKARRIGVVVDFLTEKAASDGV